MKHGCHNDSYEYSGFRALVTFGLNALYGRHQIRKDVWGGDWDFSNAYELIKYTAAKKYPIDAWEFGMHCA